MLEAQYSWTGNNNSGVLFPGGVLVNSNSDQLGSVTGRLGYSFGPALLYAKGGYAWKDNNNLTAIAGRRAGRPSPPTAAINDGYTVGAGLEYMFAPNWSAKIEYQYYNFGSTTFLTAGRRRSAPASTTTSTPSRPASTIASTGVARLPRVTDRF